MLKLLFRSDNRESRVRELVLAMRLLDPEWYVKEYPDVAAGKLDPLEHFVRYGDKEGRSPHPLFDAQWYFNRYPDVSATGGSPLIHYCENGAAEGYDPGPYFSSAFYRANNPASIRNGSNPLAHFIDQWSERNIEATYKRIAERTKDRSCDPHPLFDMRWYLAQYGKQIPKGTNPLVFHVTEGFKRRFDAHPLIDSAWYQRAYPKRDSTICILADYLGSHWASVRSPSPLFDRQWYWDSYNDSIDPSVDPLIDYVTIGREAGRLPHPLFASDWYARKNRNADNYPGGPLCHFREIGSRRGADPHPMFSTDYFIERYPEAAKDPCGSVAYYLLSGQKEFLRPHPLFDPRWYVACNPDALDRPIAALTHLLGYGVWQNRDPHPLFDTEYYLENYPQARQPFVHPLAFYLEKGAALNHRPTSFFDAEFYARKYPECAGMEPLVHFAQIGMERGNAPNKDAHARLNSVPLPDVYNAKDNRLSRYIRAIGLTSRLVLACEAVKKDPISYDYYLGCLTANAKRWRIPASKSENPVISVILPTYNGLHFTIACIESAGRFLPDVPFEIIVADNVSTDGTEQALTKRKDIRYIRHPENLGFLRSCNRAARFARGEFIFLLNNDTLVAPGWLDELYAVFCQHSNVGLAGSKLIYPDGRLQEAGGIIWRDGSAWNYGKFQDPDHPEFNYVRETDYCSGAAIMLPKRLWDEIGGFDQMYAPSYCEDSDLALRVRSLGYSVLYAPHSVVTHFEGMTQGRDTASGIKSFQISNTEKLLARWRPMISNYQPNGEQLHLAKDRGFTKRALFIDECTPNPREDAGSVTAINLMRLLRSRGYLVTFVPRSNYLYLNEQTLDLQREGIEVLYGHHVISLTEHLEQHGQRYDIVFMMRPQSFENHIDTIVQHAPKAKRIYHTIDLHYLRMEREAVLKKNKKIGDEAAHFKKVEFDAFDRCHASIVHSTVELDVLRKDLGNVDKVHVFGWASHVSTASPPFDKRKGAVFVGGFNHAPNVDAVLFFVNDVLPLVWKKKPDFTFHVVGSKVPKEIQALASNRVIVHGFVDDLEPLFGSVQMAVAPLRYGAGIKGKIATAMCVGLPNVITTIGAEGMGLVHGRDCLIADEPKDIAALVLGLTDDQSVWERISAASIRFAEANFGTTAASKVFDSILESVGETPQQITDLRLLSPTGRREVPQWPLPLSPLASVNNLAQWRSFKKSNLWSRVRTRDRYARIRMHDHPELGYPAYSIGAGGIAVLRSSNVTVDDAASLRDQLICPISGLTNFERLLAQLAVNAGATGNSGKRVAVFSGNNLPTYLNSLDVSENKAENADIVVDVKGHKKSISLLAKGGTLISGVGSVENGLKLVAQLRADGWEDATLNFYQSPEFGHLGDDLFVLSAVR